MEAKNVKYSDRIREFFKSKFSLIHLYSDCNERGYHLHKYEKDGLVRYFPKEKLKYRGYKWTKDFVYVNRDDEELVDFELRKGLIKISDNIDYLTSERENNNDFVQYEYSYTKNEVTYTYQNNGKSSSPTPHFSTRTVYDWAEKPDEDCDLTGYARTGHHMYVACKVERNNRGKLVLVKSPEVENLLDIKDEYPYIQEDHTVIKYEEYKMENEKEVEGPKK